MPGTVPGKEMRASKNGYSAGSNVPSQATALWPINSVALHGCCSLHCWAWLLGCLANIYITCRMKYGRLNMKPLRWKKDDLFQMLC